MFNWCQKQDESITNFQPLSFGVRRGQGLLKSTIENSRSFACLVICIREPIFLLSLERKKNQTDYSYFISFFAKNI